MRGEKFLNFIPKKIFMPKNFYAQKNPPPRKRERRFLQTFIANAGYLELKIFSSPSSSFVSFARAAALAEARASAPAALSRAKA